MPVRGFASGIGTVAVWLWLVGEARAAQMPQDVLAGVPIERSVTVYRAPERQSGAMDLDSLEGFALIRETRAIRVPAGETRVRFEGVADGIEPVSALLTGLPTGMIEKNLDGRLLSPQTLLQAAAGHPLELVRSNRKTGRVERFPCTLLSTADGGVFQTAEGLEALRCSGEFASPPK